MSGIGAREIARKFKSAGGWFIAIVGLPPTHYGLDLTWSGFVKSFDIVISECKHVAGEGLEHACIVGFHPAEVDKLANKKGLKIEEVIDLGYRIIDYVAKLSKKGLVHGIGEVGRPHYKTDPKFVVASELIMDYALAIAKDLDLVVHLHLEQGGLATAMDIKERLRKIGIPKDKVLLHHTRPGTLEHVIDYGLIPSVPGLYPVLKICAKYPPKYMVESDFIDDPKRPGVVIEPWNMIENQIKILNEGHVGEEYLWKINVDNVVKFYGVKPP